MAVLTLPALLEPNTFTLPSLCVQPLLVTITGQTHGLTVFMDAVCTPSVGHSVTLTFSVTVHLKLACRTFW
jgi:hypothetical protein